MYKPLPNHTKFWAKPRSKLQSTNQQQPFDEDKTTATKIMVTLTFSLYHHDWLTVHQSTMALATATTAATKMTIVFSFLWSMCLPYHWLQIFWLFWNQQDINLTKQWNKKVCTLSTSRCLFHKHTLVLQSTTWHEPFSLPVCTPDLLMDSHLCVALCD